MGIIFKQATVVIVIDEELQLTCSMNDAPEAIVMRLYGSAWARRIWTLQESILGYELMTVCISSFQTVFCRLCRSCRSSSLCREKNRLQPPWLTWGNISGPSLAHFDSMRYFSSSEVPMYIKLPFAFNVFSSRTTTKAVDK